MIAILLHKRERETYLLLSHAKHWAIDKKRW